jgi:23S rRNA pseudouridine2605 synthase
LIRVAFGPFDLGDLDDGAVREIETSELRAKLGEQIVADSGADFDAPLAMEEKRHSPPRHSGAGQRPEPGIQTRAPRKHLDSGSPLRGPRNDKKKSRRRDRSGGPRPKYPRPR